ncbi:HAUS augmin like complex subunit 6 L homeolog isoform X1 [Xenopus laevis]|uniref:HAUS augmin like complex subunit 6 L homeolog isoform X1 n=1 Tax=Xenopus laevis TaxID=8355 RepID=A0A8J1MAE8_XENLA|nr:HAUS augmin like complex subunit 6 L homeolog isoform X1 [Xenopus laevis]
MQSGSRPQLAWQREHMWLALQGLGFESGAEAANAGKTLVHVTFGVNMFDKPNKDAFYVVFHFLFGKLDNMRCKEVFRYCWPPLDKKRDAEFRKACCEWLKKISDEVGAGFPQVVASIFLSPGGPKFVHLLYHFARYVMLQHIKRDADAGNVFISEALQSKIQDPQKALARNKLARQKYLKVLQKENLVIEEYQRKAQLAEKVDRKISDKDENIQKTRCMWNTIMQMLKEMEKEVDVVDAVVRGNIDQYCLDGTNATLNIPNLLISRIESEMHRLQMDNVYEAGKVNLITVVQLLNEALKLVSGERSLYDCKGVRLDLQYLHGKAKFESEVLTRLRNMRHKIKREDLVSIEKIIADREREWERKWEKILGKCPFSLLKGLNPALELNPPMAPFSFDPASEEVLKSSVFCHYPASLQEYSHKEKPLKDFNQDHSGELVQRLIGATVLTRSGRKSTSSLGMATPNRRRMSLNEREFQTPTMSDRIGFQRTPSSAVQKRRADVSWKTAANSPLPCTPTPYKQDPKNMARQQLAQQVADYIVSESPRSSGGRGMELDDLLGVLSSDPFLSRKEIPRTPENLISDIRSSWRKAIQSEESSVVASPVAAPCMDSTAELESAHCSQIDLSMACFLSTSHASDQNDCSGTRIPHNTGGNKASSFHSDVVHHESIDLKSEIDSSQPEDLILPIKENEPADKLINLLVDKKESENADTLTNPVEFLFSNQPISKLMDKTMFISVAGQENLSAHTTLSWNSSNMITSDSSSDTHEIIQFGILHETLPENAGNVSLNSTLSLGGNEEPSEKSELPDHDFTFDRKEHSSRSMEGKMDINSIRSRYEALKRTLTSLTDEEYHGDPDTSNMRFTKHKSESSLILGSDVYSPVEKVLSLDLEYLTTPSPKDRKLSLPQLISFSPETIRSEKQEDLLDVFESQDFVNPNKTFDFTSSGLDLHKSTDEGPEQLIKL